MSTYAGSSRPPAASTRSSADRPGARRDLGDLPVLDDHVDPGAVRQGCVDDRQPCHAAIRPSIDHNGAVSLYRDEGVVLRTQKLGEADRIITLLTRSHGRVRAVGKGVRRTRSKFGARLEPFTHVDLQIYEGRSLDVVQQAETIASYGDRIADDYARYTSGTVMLETAERLTAEEKEPATQQFLLLVGGLRTLAEAAHAPGWCWTRSCCARWPSRATPRPSTTARAAPGPGRTRSSTSSAGGAVCGACRPAGSVSPARGTLDLLAALLSGDWETADASEPRHRREGSGLVAAYLQWHLERGLRSLPMVERT